jgi:hypothetical protein
MDPIAPTLGTPAKAACTAAGVACVVEEAAAEPSARTWWPAAVRAAAVVKVATR